MGKIKKEYYYESKLFILIRSIMAGILIGIAGTVYLLTNKSLIGVFLFSFGLITIITQDFFLYTGKIGFLKFSKPLIWKIPLMIFGNFIGTWIVANLMLLTKYKNKLQILGLELYNNKINDFYLSLFILAIFCGIMMYLAVKGYGTVSLEDNFGLIYIIFPIMLFILCGFEHSIADMYYFNLSKNIFNYNLKDLFIILIILTGNGIGAKIIPMINKIKIDNKF